MEGLVVEAVHGAAQRAGLAAGDEVVAVDGRPAEDVLDLEAAVGGEVFSVTVLRRGEKLALSVHPEQGEGHGVELLGGLGTAVRRCRNDCRFCFIDQVPSGLRSSLTVKDDDYRLSFLHGAFITLTNMGERDLARVERLRLSPLFVSLHDWDDERRARLMGAPARASREKLLRLARAGIELHVQVVLCPGWNDGDALTGTIAGLSAVPQVADVGIVPVSLAREGELRRVTSADAAAALAVIEDAQPDLLRRRGVRFAHGADELYLLAGRRPPAGDADLQYENGVGIVASTHAEASEARLPSGVRGLALLVGVLARPVIEEVCSLLARRRTVGPARVRPLVVENELFGPHVTVTGLLGGREVVRALREQPLATGEWLLAPASFLPSQSALTLDDVSERELRDACEGRLAVGDGLGAALAKVEP